MWRWWGSAVASFGLLGILTYGFWGDIWCRLGPAETYAVLGTAFYLSGAVALLCNSATNPPVLGAQRLLAWEPFVRRRCGRHGQQGEFFAAHAMHLGVGRLVAVAAPTRNTRSFHDAIVNCGGFDDRLFRHSHRCQFWTRYLFPRRRHFASALRLLTGLGQVFLHRGDGICVLAGVGIVAGIALVAFRKGRFAELRPWLRARRRGAGVSRGPLCVAVLFLQRQLAWQQPLRFSGPARTPVHGPVHRLDRVRVRFLNPNGPSLTPASWALLAVVTSFRGFSELHAQARNNANATVGFAQALHRVVVQLQSEPTTAILFVSHQVGDTEPTCSVRRFLRAPRSD